MNAKSFILIMESGLAIAVVSTAVWVGAQANTIQYHTDTIKELRADQKVLSDDLVNTQKEIIRRLTRIETKMGQ